MSRWDDRPRRQGHGLAWIEAGEGMPLLLLHGVGLRAEAGNALVDGLCDRAEVRAVDLPGHGHSEALAEPAGLADYVARLCRWLEQWRSPVFVAGHSFGAMLALALATRHPAHCRGVVCLNAVGERTPAATRAVRARARSLPTEGAADPSATLERWFGEDLHRDEARACRRWLGSGSAAGYRAAYRVFAGHGCDALPLAGLDCPALFITGRLDPNSTPAMSRALAAACGGRAVILDDAAHMAPMTHAGTVVEALRDFLGAERSR